MSYPRYSYLKQVWHIIIGSFRMRRRGNQKMTWHCNGKGANCSIDPCPGTSCEFYNGQGARQVKTRADAFRSMSDDELVTSIEELLPDLMEAGNMNLIEKICDGEGCDEDGECSSLRHRACILRYLHQPAEED